MPDKNPAVPTETGDVTPEAQPARPRTVIWVAIGVAVLLAVAVAVLGLVFGTPSTQRTSTATQSSTNRTGPLALVPVPAPDAGTAECSTLVAALPTELSDGPAALGRRELAQPAPTAAAAWGGDAGRDAVILRCGMPQPQELTPISQLLEVSGVRWLELPGAASATWVAVDRPVYVALTVPQGSGTGPLQDISAAVRSALPAVKVTTNR